MRSLTLFLLATMLAGCASAATKAVANFRELQAGAYATASYEQPSLMVARDADSYHRIWNVVISPTVPPAVDFGKESVVFLIDQQRTTGGYSLDAEGVSLDKGKAVIRVTSRRPPSGSAVAQVLTSPFVVVAVSKPNLESAEWIDAVSGKTIARDAKPQKKPAAE